MNQLTVNRFFMFKFKLKLCNPNQMISVVNISSHVIRKRFLDYFIKENNHTFVRSSPVVPFCDRSVAFVNAGMNQFKGIFLGDLQSPCPRAANSQKCIRVGGKHNDLSAVGHDSYHHTFFEMLGNWSFGDYFKSTACELAWKLLTTPPFSLDPKRLYVTYFGGNLKLGLPADLETKEIWRSIGVESDHIIQFGVKDNFWEMGPTGPCGPCTEIHYDHVGGRLGSDRVNQGYSDLTELWNIVFIQYNRNEDESLTSLPRHHVDTGMGFERLVALLQQKQSNYDTDLFMPLLGAIAKTSKFRPYEGKFGYDDVGGIDAAYRILADHTRMATVAMADHMFPDNNHKLRRVLRKALIVSEENFKMKKGGVLVKAISNQVAEILSPTYPEIGVNLKQVHYMIDHESELLKVLKGGSAKQWQELTKQDQRLAALTGYEAPGLPAGYKEIMSCLDKGTKVLSGELAFHLYDTHGLDPDTMEDLAEILELEFMRKDFENLLSKVKEQSRVCAGSEVNQGLSKDDIEKLKKTLSQTDDSFKYMYTRQKQNRVPKYIMNQLETSIEAVILNNKLIENKVIRLKAGEDVGVITGRTCFYSEAGGQEADRGSVVVLGNKAEQMFTVYIEHVVNCAGYIVHYGKVSTTGQNLPEYEIEIGNKAYLGVDVDHRIGNMCNHTTTHLLNAALRKAFTVTCQKGSKVTHDRLELHFSVFGEPCNNNDIFSIEENVRRVIRSQVPVSRSTVCVTDLLAMSDVNLLPGEVYPQDEIHLIQIVGKDLISKEACCGTHVQNTGDISEICVTNIRSQGAGSKVIEAVTGAQALKALSKGQQESDSINALVEGITKLLEKEALDEKQPSMNKTLKFCCHAKGRKELKQAAYYIEYQTELIAFDVMFIRNCPDISLFFSINDLDGKIQVAKRNIKNKEDLPYIVRFELLQTLEGLAKKIKDLARGSLRQSLETEMKALLAEKGSSAYIVHFLHCSSHLDNVPLQKATKLCSDLPVVVFAYSDGQVKARCCVPEKWVKSGVTAEDWMSPVLIAVGGSGGAPRGQDPRLVYNMTSCRVSRDKLEATAEAVVAVASKTASNLFK